MDFKMVELVSRKMKATEILLQLVPIYFLGASDKKCNDWLAITSEFFYFLFNNHIKKQVSIQDIIMVTVSAYSREMILHCAESDIRLSSFHNAKIFKNILKVREKVLNNCQLFTVLIQKQKSLEKFMYEEKKKSFLSSLFNRNAYDGKSRRESLYSTASRNSFCKLEVSDKSFLQQVSQKVYSCHYENIKLLYISGGYNFYFDQFDYAKQELSPRTFLYSSQGGQQSFIMRRIIKEKEEYNKQMRKYLMDFKLNSNREEILYAIESDKYFSVISPFVKEQKDLETLLQEENTLKQIDLVSIFYKLMALAEEGHCIFHSLRPKYIIVRDNIIVQQVLCINQADTNFDYLAPEELDPDIVISVDPFLVNLWKIGILLFEAAFLAVPFPIEHLAWLLVHNKPLKLSFPYFSQRSPEFKNFLSEILQIESTKRGGGPGWKQKLFEHKWVKQTMR